MKLILDKSSSSIETEIKITFNVMDENLKQIINQIKLQTITLIGKKDGIISSISIDDIFYIETVDNKTFLYTKCEVYQSTKKLYEIENELINTSFVRISKSQIINTNIVSSVKAQFSGRLEAVLNNNEKIIVSKHYTMQFRNKFSNTL